MKPNDIILLAKNYRPRSGAPAVVWFLIAALFAVFAGLGSAEAAGKAKVYIVPMAKALPKANSRNPAGKLKSFAARNKTRVLKEKFSKRYEDWVWSANVIIDFRRPLNHPDYRLVFKDATVANDHQATIDSLDINVFNQKEKVVVAPINLPRKKFKGPRKLNIEVWVGQKMVATTKLDLAGRPIKYKNNFDFSKDP